MEERTIFLRWQRGRVGGGGVHGDGESCRRSGLGAPLHRRSESNSLCSVLSILEVELQPEWKLQNSRLQPALSVLRNQRAKKKDRKSACKSFSHVTAWTPQWTSLWPSGRRDDLHHVASLFCKHELSIKWGKTTTLSNSVSVCPSTLSLRRTSNVGWEQNLPNLSGTEPGDDSWFSFTFNNNQPIISLFGFILPEFLVKPAGWSILLTCTKTSLNSQKE